MSSPAYALTNSQGSPSMAARPQVYQIDFTAIACGKKIASTKRRVRWRFGFANPEALANGETGTSCRGEEHDVTIVWSITSGKRLVLADGQEVNYSNSRTNLFEFSWTMKGNHVLKIAAHASPPLQVNPGFRQYDFFVDGQSFFSFPKVYRLGLGASDPRGAGSPRSAPSMSAASRGYNPGTASMRSNGSAAGLVSIEAPHNPDEEEAYLQEAIKNSLNEGGVPGGAPAPPLANENLLLDFAAPMLALPAPAPGAMTPYVTAPAPSNDAYGAHLSSQASYASMPPSQQAADPWGAPAAYGAPAPPQYGAPAAAPAYGALVPAPSAHGAPPPASYGAPPVQDAYSAPPQQQDPFGAPAPALNQMGGAPANAYGAPPTQQQPPQQQQQYQQQQPPQQQQQQQPMYGQPPVVQQQPNPFGTPAPNTVSAVHDFTPASSIGFASPMAQAAPQAAPEPAPAPEPQAGNPALMSMNVLSGQAPDLVGGQSAQTNGGGSMADQAYAKLVNMDAFDLVKDKSEQKNPFEFASSSSISHTASLADMKKTNSNQPKKDIMKAAPGALVVSNNQQGNFGGYGGQLGGMGQQQMGQQQMGRQQMGQQPMGQQPMGGYGQPPMGQQPQYGQPPVQQQQQQQQYGQQPPMQQAPMQQQQYGQPPMQQYGQQPQYGQPSMQQQYGQQPFGGM